VTDQGIEPDMVGGLMDPISKELLAAGGGQAVAFYACAATAIAAAILMVVKRNPVAGVMWLVLSFIGLAGLFVTLQAYFIAVVQVLVYAGAIMVLFLFVIMLLNLRREDLLRMRLPKTPLAGVIAAALFFTAVFFVVKASTPTFEEPLAALPGGPASVGDSVRAIGLPLFRQWLLPFEITSVLLLAAIVGAVALTKKKL
jgi:NADH-quinone oxidoreductase subunit J